MSKNTNGLVEEKEEVVTNEQNENPKIDNEEKVELGEFEEEWREIPEFEGLYAVSNKGEVKSLSKQKILKTSKIYKLTKDGKTFSIDIFNLMGRAFNDPNPENNYVPILSEQNLIKPEEYRYLTNVGLEEDDDDEEENNTFNKKNNLNIKVIIGKDIKNPENELTFSNEKELMEFLSDNGSDFKSLRNLLRGAKFFKQQKDDNDIIITDFIYNKLTIVITEKDKEIYDYLKYRLNVKSILYDPIRIFDEENINTLRYTGAELEKILTSFKNKIPDSNPLKKVVTKLYYQFFINTNYPPIENNDYIIYKFRNEKLDKDSYLIKNITKEELKKSRYSRNTKRYYYIQNLNSKKYLRFDPNNFNESKVTVSDFRECTILDEEEMNIVKNKFDRMLYHLYYFEVV